MGRATTTDVGQRAEQEAFEFLIGRGLRPVARNFRSRGGEIDLIMLDGDCLAFIEVRYRASSSFSPASHTVDKHKQQKLIRTAALYGARHKRHANAIMRFDVVAVDGDSNVKWIRDAFRPNNSTF